MAAVYDYAYNVANVDKIIGPISSNHTRALALVSKMGFSEEARIKDAAHDSGDYCFDDADTRQVSFLGASVWAKNHRHRHLAPDYATLAIKQGEANLAAAKQSAYMSNPNICGPQAARSSLGQRLRR
jgi:hypothetical protein